MLKVVLSIGQCGYDQSQIGRVVTRAGGDRVEGAHSAAEGAAMMARGEYALVLVNRVFDETGESGVEFIRVQKTAGAAAMMLVSDYTDAQEAAVEAGALPGFGKSQLNEGGVSALLKAALGAGEC